MDAKKFEKNLNNLRDKALRRLEKASDLKTLEEIRIWLFGRKGEFGLFFEALAGFENDVKAQLGKMLNSLRDELAEVLENKIKEFEESELARRLREEKIDITAPGFKRRFGHLHPLTKVLERVENIFQSFGFEVIDGPEIEAEYYNFDALNIPPSHPARDLQDTFWIKQKSYTDSKDHFLLRTHTSPMQVRFLEAHNPPLRIIVPGRVFRYEATDASHDIQFHQVEGLMVGHDVSLANLIGVLEDFFKKFFGTKDLSMRIRPGYFPFVEPGIEVDIKLSYSKNPRLNDWVEIAGAGMVHPKVFEAAHLVPALSSGGPGEYQGFAFGMGLDRLAMLFYGIGDIRLFYSGDFRFLKQF